MKARPFSNSTTAGMPARATRSRCRHWTTSRRGERPRAFSGWRCGGSPDRRMNARQSRRSPRRVMYSTTPRRRERAPQQRCNAVALQLCALINSFTFDWALRQKTAATINLFILEACPGVRAARPRRLASWRTVRCACRAITLPMRRCGESKSVTPGMRRSHTQFGRQWRRNRAGGSCVPRSTRLSRKPMASTVPTTSVSLPVLPTSIFRPHRGCASRHSMH